MKKILTILFCIIVSFYARSQNIVPEDSLPPLDERLAYIFENVDFSYAGTGIVYGAGLKLIDPYLFGLQVST